MKFHKSHYAINLSYHSADTVESKQRGCKMDDDELNESSA